MVKVTEAVVLIVLLVTGLGFVGAYMAVLLRGKWVCIQVHDTVFFVA
jgi:hypothetical protein